MKRMIKFLLAILVLALCTAAVSGWRSFNIIFTTFDYTYNKEYFDFEAHISNNTKGDTFLNAEAHVKKEVSDVGAHLALGTENESGNYTILMNRSLNLCKFLAQRSTEPIIRIIYDDILKRNNEFIKSCPIQVGSYYIRGYRVDEETLPSYIPEVAFFMELEFFLPKSKTQIFGGKINGRIDKSKGFDNLKLFSLG